MKINLNGPRPAPKRKPASEPARYPESPSGGAQLEETFDAAGKVLRELPASDNSEGAVEKMLHANGLLRHLPWPRPFNETVHRVRLGDARDMSWLPAESVHLVIKGESTRKGHPAPFPAALAERLIRLFSFAGDTVLDPFAGTGTTAVAALACGRSSVSVDIEPKYVALAEQRLREATFLPMAVGATKAITRFG